MGLQLSSPDIAGLGLLRYYAGVFMGEGYDWYKAGDFGFTYMGRVEVLPLGMFEDFNEPDFERGVKPKLSLGAAYAYSDRDHRTRSIAGAAFADGGTMSAHHLTADLMFKWSGLSVLADVYWRRGQRQAGALKDEEGLPIAVQAARNGLGWTTQMGLFVPRTRLEAVGRYAGVRPPRSGATSLARLDELGEAPRGGGLRDRDAALRQRREPLGEARQGRPGAVLRGAYRRRADRPARGVAHRSLPTDDPRRRYNDHRHFHRPRHLGRRHRR